MTAAAPRALALVLLAAVLCPANSIPDPWCKVPLRTQAGWVCGEERRASSGAMYATFLGVPYAKQPLGELRFQELQPLEPWEGTRNATTEGPICPQTDVLYKGLMQPKGGMGEDCIHANVHVPLEALHAADCDTCTSYKPLPILVFIHGGGFAFGSGDTDFHGPEYLVSKGIIVITFNYRLNVFGFLSLNSSYVPGNNGVRDAVSLLRWVRDNARWFGGDAARVTVAGQSAGAALTHLLTLVPSAKGLFQRAISMSGVATSDFFSSSPQFAETISGLLLAMVGIDATLSDAEIHAQLVALPFETLMRVNEELINIFGLTTFVPVVESPHPGVTPMLLKDPELLMKSGVGKDIPLLIGFTDKECETFRPRLQEFDVVTKIDQTPALIISPRLTYKASPSAFPELIKAVKEQYFNGSDGEDAFVQLCTDAYYQYPAIRVAKQRAAIGGAPVYLYRFSYGGQRSVIKGALGIRFRGAGHIEDLTYIFRANSYLGSLAAADQGYNGDLNVINWMTDYVIDFMTSDDVPGGQHGWRGWRGVEAGRRVRYAAVARAGAGAGRVRVPTHREEAAVDFFDDLYAAATRH